MYKLKFVPTLVQLCYKNVLCQREDGNKFVVADIQQKNIVIVLELVFVADIMFFNTYSAVLILIFLKSLVVYFCYSLTLICKDAVYTNNFHGNFSRYFMTSINVKPPLGLHYVPSTYYP